MIRALLVSSCDRLADLACAGSFGHESGVELAGILRTRLPLRARRRLLGAARRAGALYYARYMLAEIHLPALWPANLRPPRLREEAGRAGAPILGTTAVDAEASLRFVRDLAPDVLLSVRPGVIFRQRFIDRVPPILNFHGSLLPEFRGIAGVLQALAAGREVLGASIHLVSDERVDRGDIVQQAELAAVPGRSVYHHTVGLYRAAAALLPAAARDAAGGARTRPNRGGSYFSWPDRSVLARLHERGRRLLEWRDVRTRTAELAHPDGG